MDKVFEDLVEFARFEAETHDVAPWGDILRHALDAGTFSRQEAQWMTTLYNTFDAYDSAVPFMMRWPTLQAWRDDPDRWEAADGVAYRIHRERRNLYGGKVLRRFLTYAELVGDTEEEDWLRAGAVGDTPAERFNTLCDYTRQVWGVGRQAAFEWAEFQGKVMDHDVFPGHAFLWESEGPRRSLQKLYGGDKNSTAQWLDDRAEETQQMLVENGVYLPIWDFETIICDFNVMRGGRYYLGKHLSVLREELELITHPQYKEALMESWYAVIPEPWCNIAPGVDKQMLKAYRDTGQLTGPFDNLI